MDTFKHIISYACDKNCSYCINEIMVHGEKQVKDALAIGIRYSEMALDGYEHIMISGGEPVINKMFPDCLDHADLFFRYITIITAHNSALVNPLMNKASDILFSIHNEYLDVNSIPDVSVNIPVYASMVVEGYLELGKQVDEPLVWLRNKGFAGATIRECYPDGQEVPNLPYVEEFSIKTHHKSNCTKESTLLLPDLSISTEKEFTTGS